MRPGRRLSVAAQVARLQGVGQPALARRCPHISIHGSAADNARRPLSRQAGADYTSSHPRGDGGGRPGLRAARQVTTVAAMLAASSGLRSRPVDAGAFAGDGPGGPWVVSTPSSLPSGPCGYITAALTGRQLSRLPRLRPPGRATDRVKTCRSRRISLLFVDPVNAIAAVVGVAAAANAGEPRSCSHAWRVAINR
jgi:hypothetical protein